MIWESGEATIPLFIFAISNAGALIWYLAKLKTELSILRSDVEGLMVEIRSLRNLYVSKEEFGGRVALSDQEHKAIWKNIDDLKERIK